MLQINHIKENKDDVISRLAVKNFKAEELVLQILTLDEQRRDTQKKMDDSLAEANSLAKEIGGLFQKGLAAEANTLKEKTAELKVL